MWCRRAIAVCACVAAACGGGSGGASSPSTVTTAAGASMTLTGRWLGHDVNSTITYVLTQDGSSVTGTSAFTEPGASGAGTVSGTVSNGVFSARDHYGSITDGTNRNCSADLQLTLTISGGSMSGPYMGTNSCTGAFDGQVQFTKQ